MINSFSIAEFRLSGKCFTQTLNDKDPCKSSQQTHDQTPASLGFIGNIYEPAGRQLCSIGSTRPWHHQHQLCSHAHQHAQQLPRTLLLLPMTSTPSSQDTHLCHGGSLLVLMPQLHAELVQDMEDEQHRVGAKKHLGTPAWGDNCKACAVCVSPHRQGCAASPAPPGAATYTKALPCTQVQPLHKVWDAAGCCSCLPLFPHGANTLLRDLSSLHMLVQSKCFPFPGPPGGSLVSPGADAVAETSLISSMHLSRSWRRLRALTVDL